MPHVIGPIVPAGSYPGLRDVYLAGGYRIVENVAARDAIPSEQRVAGMAVQTRVDGRIWRLNPDLTSWAEMQFGSEVTSVFGRTGAVTAQTGDYTFAEIGGQLNAQRIADGTITNQEFQRLAGVTEDIQTQINNRATISHTHPLSQITQSGANPNQVPVWNGEQWEAQDQMGGGSNAQAPDDSIYEYTFAHDLTPPKRGILFEYNSIGTDNFSGYTCRSFGIDNGIIGYAYGKDGIADLIFFRKVLHVMGFAQVAPSAGNMFCGLFKHTGSNYPEPDPVGTISEIGFRLADPDKLELLMQNGNTGYRWTYTTNKSIIANKMYRFMIIRNSSGIYDFFVDGSKVGDTAGAPVEAYPTDTILKPGASYRVFSSGPHAFYYYACAFWS